MKKMPCLYVREFHGRSSFTITEQVTPGCEWVVAREGAAYIKRDGTACAVIGGELYRRYDAKRGKTPPVGAIPCADAPDEITGHWPHWLKVGDDPQDKWHRLAWDGRAQVMPDGTYELCGPHFQANPYGYDRDMFIGHTWERIRVDASEFNALRDTIQHLEHEGIVFHHPDGRMCKIRRDDFGFDWPLKS